MGERHGEYRNFNINEPWVRQYFESLVGEEMVREIVDRCEDKETELKEFKFLSGEKI